jgi:hypothetical protein
MKVIGTGTHICEVVLIDFSKASELFLKIARATQQVKKLLTIHHVYQRIEVFFPFPKDTSQAFTTCLEAFYIGKNAFL